MDNSQRQLHAIVGAALRGMAAAGASDEDLGRFAEEHRTKVAQILGLAPATGQAPDLLALINDTVQAAVRAAVQGIAPGPRSEPKTKIQVLVQGTRTSVTIRPELLEQLKASVQGGPRDQSRGAKRILNDLAAAAPPDFPNRSEWLERRLETYLQASQAQPAAQASHH